MNPSPKGMQQAGGVSHGQLVEVVMEAAMLLDLLLPANSASLLVGGSEVRVPSGFGTRGTQRNQLFQIPTLASRALSFRRGGPQKVFKAVSAMPASVFIDRHKSESTGVTKPISTSLIELHPGGAPR